MRAYKNEANGGDDSEASSRKAMQSGAILYKKEYYRSSGMSFSCQASCSDSCKFSRQSHTFDTSL